MAINPLDPVSTILGNFMDRIDNSMEKAQSLADELLMKACQEVDIVVQDASFAFKDNVDFAFGKLNESLQNSLAQIDSMITDIENRTFTKIDDIMSRSQQIVNTLPFRSSDPQLRKFTPKFIVTSQMHYPVAVEVDGNFIDASKPNYTPMLKVNGQVYQVSENTTQSLKFIVPAAAILPSTNNVGYSFTQANIILPYGGNFLDVQLLPKFIKDILEQGGLLSHDSTLLDIHLLPKFIKDLLEQEDLVRRNEATFRIIIGTLPSSPGKITLRYNFPQSKRISQHIVTQTWNQNSSDDDIPDDWQHNTKKYYADTIKLPWNIDTHSIQFVREWSQGRCLNDNPGDDYDFRYDFICSNPVTFGVATIHQTFGTSGKVKFHFEYDIYQDILVDNWVSEEITLKWGESRTFDYQIGYWKVIFDSFNGKHSEWEGPSGDNPFLTVSLSGKSLILKAADPQTLKWG